MNIINLNGRSVEGLMLLWTIQGINRIRKECSIVVTLTRVLAYLLIALQQPYPAQTQHPTQHPIQQMNIRIQITNNIHAFELNFSRLSLSFVSNVGEDVIIFVKIIKIRITFIEDISMFCLNLLIVCNSR